MSVVGAGRGARLGTLFVAAGALLAAVVSVVPAQLGCSRFAEPCHLAGEVTLFASARSGAPELLEGPSGETVLRFVTYATSSADAGAEGGSDGSLGAIGGFGTVSAASSPVPSKVDLVVYPGPQGGTLEASYAAPLTLAGRVGSTANIGATYTGHGVLYSWLEESTRTDPDGKVHAGAALRYALSTGADAPTAQDVVSCDDCAITVAPVSTKTATFLFYAVQRQGTPGESTVLRLGAAGDVLSTQALPKALGPPGSVPRVFGSNGALVARLPGGSYVVRDDLSLGAGPFVPTGSSLSFVYGDGDPYAAWLAVPGTSNGADAGTAAIGDIGFEGAVDVGQDLMLGRFTSGDATTRLSTASSITGVARDGDRFGVAFVSGDREYFALAGADGQKVGGDIDIGSAVSGPSFGQVGGRVLRSPRAPHTFSVLGLSGTKLVSREVSCE